MVVIKKIKNELDSYGLIQNDFYFYHHEIQYQKNKVQEAGALFKEPVFHDGLHFFNLDGVLR
jgi:hypothetical protein